jgi:hypothetical protein
MSVGLELQGFSPKSLEHKFGQPIYEFLAWLRDQQLPPRKPGQRNDPEPIRNLKDIIGEVYDALRKMNFKPEDALSRIKECCKQNGLNEFANMHITSTNTVGKWKNNNNDMMKTFVIIFAEQYLRDFGTTASKDKLLTGLAEWIVESAIELYAPPAIRYQENK